jgi:asparagine N-glycosylation enzyme membrane subunit Stt3
MLTLVLAPAFSLHFLLQVVLFIAACGIVFWLLTKVKIPEPFNYVLYAALAGLALYVLFWLLGAVG